LYPTPSTWIPIAARRRLWLHILLLLLTVFSTTFVGARIAENFHHNRPAFELESDLDGYVEIWHNPSRMAAGLLFSLPLLLILLAHEFGHYLACVHYRLDASLPYFLPAPTFIGTLGAFIRIRSPIFTRKELFDVGVAGPIAGFVFLIRALEALIFPGVPAADIYLHPIARAAWVGIFATALNLLPFGQLDGGHILYAFAGPRFRHLTRVFWVVLLALGYFYWPWLIWAAILFFFGLKHPPIYDPEQLSRGRVRLAFLSIGIFVVSFMPVPIATAAL
jgi:membrane-associated protease RseP (regulator of RpoE activity)